MRFISASTILVVILLCGCVTQKDLNAQFVKMSDEYYSRYCNAQSPDAAIVELKDYLAAVDATQRRWATKVRYGLGRALAETRISLIYDQLGNSQNASVFMDRALQDIQKDPYFDESQPYDKVSAEASLKRMVEKIDGWNTIVWKKAVNHGALSTH